MKRSKFSFAIGLISLAATVVSFAVDTKFRKSLEHKYKQFEAETISHVRHAMLRASIGAEAATPREPTIAVGRIVHFVMQSGAIRPAMITEDLRGRCVGPNPLALSIFHTSEDQQSRDFMGDGVIRKQPVNFEETGRIPGTWHWPKRV